MSKAASTESPTSNQWIFNPTIDLLIGCGAWSLPLLIGSIYLSQRDAIHASFIFYFLSVFCNQPHYMATVYRAYRTPEDFRKYRFFTVYLTVFAVLTAVVVHWAPFLFPWLLTFYITWSPWHYTGQNFGISMMMIRRAGAVPSDGTRRLLWWSYFASYLAWFLALHNSATPDQATLVIIRIPALFAQIGKFFCLQVYLIAGGYALYKLIRQNGLGAMAGPLTLFFTQFLWFLLPELLRDFTKMEFPATYSSAGILAFMHCAQYLWITTYYAKREAESDVLKSSRRGRPSFQWGGYYFVLILGGIALFLPGPWAASRFFGHDLVESFLIFTALINLHHFMLDGAIWKLRDGRIARMLLGRNPPMNRTEGANQNAGSKSRIWLFGPSPGARGCRMALAIGLIMLAMVDQTQYWLTLNGSNQASYTLAERFNPQDTRVYFQRAKGRAESGDQDAAIEDLRHAVALNPYSVPAQQLLGELLIRSGDFQAADEHYERMLTLIKPDATMLVNSALIASRVGNEERAIKRLEAATKLDPNDARITLNLADAFDRAGQVQRAIDEFEFYTELHREDVANPEILQFYLYVGLKLGDLYMSENQPEKAAAWYRQVIALGRHHMRPEETGAAEARLNALNGTGLPAAQ